MTNFNNIVNIKDHPLEDLNYMKHNNKKTFRHLCCHKCLSSENKQTAFKTRDANSAINLMNIFKYLLNFIRPKKYNKV